MQAEKPKIHQVRSEVSSSIKSILSCYLKKEYLDKTGILNIDYINPRNQLPYNEMYYGIKVGLFLENVAVEKSVLHSFQCDCLSFLIEATKQIFLRFNFKETILKDVEILAPQNILESSSIISLVKHFPNLVKEDQLQEIDNEWRALKHIDLNFSQDAEEFWKGVSKLMQADDTPAFPKLSQFIYEIFSLPHSSANTERIFLKLIW